MPRAKAISWSQAEEDFITSRQAKGCTDKTVEGYRAALRLLRVFGETEGIRPGELTTKTMRRFAVWLKGEGRPGRRQLAEASVRTHLRAVKAFVRFGFDEAWFGAWIGGAPEVSIPRVTERPKPTLEPREVSALLDASPGAGFLARRNRLLVRVLVDTGCRLSEALGLPVDRVFLTERRMELLGKARQPRSVPIGANTLAEAVGYMTARRGHLTALGMEDPGLVFFTEAGGPLKPRMAEKTLERLAKRAGVDPKKCHPHAFRHAYARAFLVGGGDAMVLREMLGHSSLDMTRRYLRDFGPDALRAAAPYSPGDRIGARSWSDQARPAMRVVGGRAERRRCARAPMRPRT